MRLLIIALPVFFIIISGIAASCSDVNAHRKQDPHNRLFKYYTKKGEAYLEWWIGGNMKFRPENPFTADFWHFSNYMQSMSYSGLILSVILQSHFYPSPYLALYAFTWWFRSIICVIFYHYVWRDNLPWWDFVKEALTFRNLSIKKY